MDNRKALVVVMRVPDDCKHESTVKVLQATKCTKCGYIVTWERIADSEADRIIARQKRRQVRINGAKRTNRRKAGRYRNAKSQGRN